MMRDNPYQAPQTVEPGLPPVASAGSSRRLRLAGSLALALFLGWSVWAFSNAVTGKVEPWDSNSWYYWGCLVAIGIVATCLDPRRCWPAVLGAFVGQVAYMELFLRGGAPIVPSFVGVAIFGVLPVFLGALLPFVGWSVWRWAR
jgi:hypothetical protein